MSIRFRPFAILLLVGFPFLTHAQAYESENQSTLHLEDLRTDRNRVDGNIDDEITNARMRAESGSRSKWSASVTTNFTGGTINQAFGTNRPMIISEPGKQDNTSLDSGVGARYRWSKNDSVTAALQFAVNTPFQGHVNNDQPQLNLLDPKIAYNRVGKLGRVQATAGLGFSPGTSSQSQGVDRVMQYSVDSVFLHVFENKITTGLAFEGYYNQYTSSPGGNAANRRALTSTYGSPGAYYGGDSRTEYLVGAFPYVEYAINDTYQLRTVFGWFNFRHLYGDDKSARWLRLSAFQSVGVGMAVTRDIYLYPNVQFIPDDLRVERTNVAFNAQLNVF